MSMDEDRFRKELEARRQAHGGDLPAAVDEVLRDVIADVETMPSNWKELREADELLEGED
ncbi:MAG TPA: hypothetical protein VFI17_09050 [Solirubrobacterales bacterium]|nr:hypothetical protein [Solirubrobacterales bacterium]